MTKQEIIEQLREDIASVPDKAGNTIGLDAADDVLKIIVKYCYLKADKVDSFLPDEVQVKLGIDDLMPNGLEVAFWRGYNRKHNEIHQPDSV